MEQTYDRVSRRLCRFKETLSQWSFVAPFVLASYLLWSPAAQASDPAISRLESMGERGGRFEFRVNCGGTQFTTEQGISFAADHAYSDGFGYGYESGWSQSTWHTIGGTHDPELYDHARFDFVIYYVEVPNGDYRVTLHFADLHSHFPGTNEMDVDIEGVQVLDRLDIFAEVERDYALRYQFMTNVSDGLLEIDVQPYPRSQISAIEVVEIDAPASSLAQPVLSSVVNGFHAVVLDWDDNTEEDLAGYDVYRRVEPAGPTLLLTETRNLVSRYVDLHVDPGTTYSYDIEAVGIFGNTSLPLTDVEATPLAPVDGVLPLVHISADSADLALINVDPYVDLWIPVDVTINDTLYANVELRYRGNTLRTLSKKSWKIKFQESQLFRGKARKINLNSGFPDRTLLREGQAYELFREQGVPTPEIEPVRLVINDFYCGVSQMIEQVDEYFLENHDLDNDILIYKCFAPLDILPDSATYMESYTKETHETGESWGDIIELIEMLNYSTSEEIYENLVGAFDMENLFDYYAAVTMPAGFDYVFKNFFLGHDQDSDDIWQIYPWDKDLTFGPETIWDTEPNVDRPVIAGQTNKLIKRMIDPPPLRNFHLCNVLSMIEDPFSVDVMGERFDTAFDRVLFDGERDWRKRGWESNEHFYDGPIWLTNWVEDRVDFLESTIWTYWQDQTLTVNEMMAANDSYLPDEYGEYDDWLELYHAGDSPLSLAGLYLTDDLSEPYMWALPDTVLMPGDLLLVWADDDEWQGPLHANFKLDRNGGALAVHRSGAHVEVVDFLFFGPQGTDLAWGRVRDGLCPFDYLEEATPGESNDGAASIEGDGVKSAGSVVLSIQPNPIGGAGIISLSQPQSGLVKVGLFDVRGRRVRELHTGALDPGTTEWIWNGRDDDGRAVPTGVYWCRADVAKAVLTERVVLIR